MERARAAARPREGAAAREEQPGDGGESQVHAARLQDEGRRRFPVGVQRAAPPLAAVPSYLGRIRQPSPPPRVPVLPLLLRLQRRAPHAPELPAARRRRRPVQGLAGPLGPLDRRLLHAGGGRLPPRDRPPDLQLPQAAGAAPEGRPDLGASDVRRRQRGVLVALVSAAADASDVR